MRNLECLEQTRRSLIQKIVGLASALAFDSLSFRMKDPNVKSVAGGYVIVNGWVLTDKDMRFHQEIPLDVV